MTDSGNDEHRTHPLAKGDRASSVVRRGDYVVGYGKPPKASRFVKGKSGNPKGRPKGSRSVNALLDKALSSPVTISEAGRLVTIEQRAALFKALVARAIKGDARSAALVIRLMEQVGQLQEPAQQVTRIERVIIYPKRQKSEAASDG